MVNKYVAIAASVLTLSASSLAAETLTFDQSGIAGGDVITSFSHNGVTGDVTAFNNPTGTVNQAMIFDSNTLTGGDDDLVAPFYGDFENGVGVGDGVNPGNILIISEDGDDTDPDDNGRGGTITFSFDQAVNFFGARIFDDVRNFFISSDSGEESERLTLAHDNQVGHIATSFMNVREVTFHFGSASGAIDNLDFELAAVPVPASLPLLLAGVAGFGIMRRRKKA